jgi:hypothetical protein
VTDAREDRIELAIVTTALAVPSIGAAVAQRLASGPVTFETVSRSVSEVRGAGDLFGYMLILLVGYLLRLRGVPLESLGLRPRSVLATVGIALALVLGELTATVRVNLLTAAQDVWGAWAHPEALFSLLALAAGVAFEEFTRAYLLFRTEKVTGRAWLGWYMATAWFSAEHLWYAPREFWWNALTGGAVYTTVMLVTRNVPAVFLAHVAWDMICLWP